MMKNNIKKASVKFWEDLLSFQHFMQILSLLQLIDYHLRNIITNHIQFSVRRYWETLKHL